MFLSSASAKVIGEFTSLEELSDDSDIATVSGSLADGSGFIRSKRRIEPSDPTRQFRLPIVKSISLSILLNTCVKLDWWG
jgi:hypothetical protein